VDTVRTGEEPGAEPSQTCFDFVYQPLRDESGAVGGIVVHAVEVTQQILLLRQTTQQAEELATQRQQLEEQTALLQEQAAELEQQVAEAQENARQMEAANEALAASTEEARAAVQVAERERERAAAALEEEARLVGVLHRIGQTLASETGLQRIVQTATDEATALTGARFGAFFYNLVNERGESYTLYTLSGVHREAFSSFPMPRNTHVFGPTFRGEGVVRSGDITRDPRYGQNPPYHGMPPGHLPVRSYLAVPVVSRSGEVLGGLFFGHEQTEVFTERAERIATGIAGWAAVAMDNALLHEAERSARQEAEAANQAKSAFLATMSHELRTPLNAIGGYAQILEMGVRGPVTEAQRSDLERVIRAQEHLLGLINDVLNFAKLEAGRVEFEVRDVPVEEALAHVEELVAPQTAARGITYRRGASPEGACVRADLEKLQQVLLNLLSNAVKFTDPGGEITVWWETGRDGVRIHVSDTGIGIPPKKLDSIFEPFVQVDPDLTRTRQGTGLGLAISRELARGMGGDLAAASAPGEGSTFTLRLRAPA
jgi:signal transduction histidine kinase